MEQTPREESMAALSSSHEVENATTRRPFSWPKKGGYKTMPFIIVNESFEKAASLGLLANMIFYLMKDYNMDAANGASILLIWSALSSAMTIVGAFISDSYFGRFPVIIFGSFANLLGSTLLWLTAMLPQLKPPPCTQSSGSNDCTSPTSFQLFVLLSSFGLISIGAGCIRPCSIAFGADQLGNEDKPRNQRILERYINWYYVSLCVSAIIGLTIMVYVQDQFGWRVGFGIPAIMMFFSALIFILGSSLYVILKAEKRVFTGLIQVIVAASRKMNSEFPSTDVKYYQGPDSKFTAPTHKLRFLNRACIIRNPEIDLKPDGTASNPWKLCTVDSVESLKAMVRVLPIWSTGIMVYVAANQSGFTALQANVMDRHVTSKFQIPAASFVVFTVLSLTIWLILYDCAIVPLLAKFGFGKGLGPKTRMGIGLILTVAGIAVAAIVESVRRKTAIDQGLIDKPNTVINMSAMWLILQYSVFGLAEAFNGVGQMEFFYSQLPKSMSSFALAYYHLGMAVASLISTLLVKIIDGVTKKGGKESWLANNLNKAHLDYYYWIITVLCLFNFGYFLLCCWSYGTNNDQINKKKSEKVEMEETLQSKLAEIRK